MREPNTAIDPRGPLWEKRSHAHARRIALRGECLIELDGEAFGSMRQTFGGDTLNTAVYLADQSAARCRRSRGVRFLRSVIGPLASIKFHPTGGIDAALAVDYLARANVAAVGGSWMASDELLDQGRLADIRRLAEQAAGLCGSIGPLGAVRHTVQASRFDGPRACATATAMAAPGPSPVHKSSRRQIPRGPVSHCGRRGRGVASPVALNRGKLR